MAETVITLDKDHEIPVFSKVCVYCRHLDLNTRERKCKAFPKGIPMEIWIGENDHKEPYENDKGIRFERI